MVEVESQRAKLLPSWCAPVVGDEHWQLFHLVGHVIRVLNIRGVPQEPAKAAQDEMVGHASEQRWILQGQVELRDRAGALELQGLSCGHVVLGWLPFELWEGDIHWHVQRRKAG